MKYRIVYDTSTDKYSSKRLYIVVGAGLLSTKIRSLQVQGYIIHSVAIDFS